MTKNRRHKINSNMTLSKWIFFAATCGVVFALYFMFCVVPIGENEFLQMGRL